MRRTTKVLEGAPSFLRLLQKGWVLTIYRYNSSSLRALCTKSDKLTVQGKLARIMAIGGESPGWAIELNPAMTVEGEQVSSMEIVYVDSTKLEALANKTVKATGTLSNVTGIETGQRPVLNPSSIKAIKQKPTKEN